MQRNLEETNDLYNNAPCGYHSLDRDTLIVRINDTELRWLGYTREEVLGKARFIDLLAPASVKTLENTFSRFKERGYVNDVEFDMARKDGTLLPVLISATAIHDESGDYVSSRSTVLDISARKAAEAHLRDREARLKLIMDSMAEGLFEVDHNGICTFVNPAALRLLGYREAAQLLGKKMHDFIHHTRADGQPCLDTQSRSGIRQHYPGDYRY